MKQFFSFFLVVVILLIAFQIAESGESCIISKKGISGFIEIGMTTSEIEENGITVGDFEKQFFTLTGQKIYKVLSSSIEFELENERVVRIWFFAQKNPSFKLFLANDGVMRALDEIHAQDILRNFGKVQKYFGTNPPKGIEEAYWDKNSYFGVETNMINYPTLPFTFGLTNKDSLEYITVSKE